MEAMNTAWDVITFAPWWLPASAFVFFFLVSFYSTRVSGVLLLIAAAYVVITLPFSEGFGMLVFGPALLAAILAHTAARVARRSTRTNKGR
jgi:hypothetical protein